ncbi:MAG: hypothetical protein ACRERD_07560 [Candidatus Binatia bacterium]
MVKQEQIPQAWMKAPERWRHLRDVCQRGEGRYTRGLFIFNGRDRKLPAPKTIGDLIVQMLKSEPMGYLS